jgi:hypothetical protein
MTPLRYADTARFPSDTLEGETVLIDSTRGHLFLFTGIAPHIWQAYTNGSTTESLIAAVVARYGEEAMAPTRAFIAALESAEMLLDAQPPATADSAPGDWPAVFVPPTMERYEDIADIIAMDPIHEVDQIQGWPKRQ